MVSGLDEDIAGWRNQMASAKGQLGYFESGNMRWKVNGVDRSDDHIAALRGIINNIEILLGDAPDA